MTFTSTFNNFNVFLLWRISTKLKCFAQCVNVQIEGIRVSRFGSRSWSHLKVKCVSVRFVSTPYLLHSLIDFHETSYTCKMFSSLKQYAEGTSQPLWLKVKCWSLRVVSAPCLPNSLKIRWSITMGDIAVIWTASSTLISIVSTIVLVFKLVNEICVYPVCPMVGPAYNYLKNHS